MISLSNITSSILPESKGALVVYDIHDWYSYRDARDWVSNIKELVSH